MRQCSAVTMHLYNMHTHRFTVRCLVWRSSGTTTTPSRLRSSSSSDRLRKCLSASPNGKHALSSITLSHTSLHAHSCFHSIPCHAPCLQHVPLLPFHSMPHPLFPFVFIPFHATPPVHFCFHSIPCHAPLPHPLAPLACRSQFALVSEDQLLPQVVCSNGGELDLRRQQTMQGENPEGHRSR